MPTASPTRAQSRTTFVDAMRLVVELVDGVADVPANEQTLIQGLIADFGPQLSTGAKLVSDTVSSSLKFGSRVLQLAILNFVHHQIGTPEREIQAMISRLYQDMESNSEKVKNRGFNFGAASAGGSNVGDGTISRLTKDENDYDLEATHIDTKTLVCVADQTVNGATKHRERFRARSTGANVNAISVGGSGRSLQNNRTMSVTSKESPLGNCGFDRYSLGSASFTAGVAALQSDSVVNDWELNNTSDVSDPTLFSLIQTASLQFRDLEGVSTPTSIRFTDNAKLRQLLSVKNVRAVASVPTSIVLHIYRESNCDGTLTCTWGSQSQAITVSGLSNGAWNTVVITLDKKLWPAVWNGTDPKFELSLASRTTGTLIVDEIEALIPMWRYDGHWYQISGGATKWVDGDEVSFTDALAGSDSQIQRMMWRFFGRHLPHNGTGTTGLTEPL